MSASLNILVRSLVTAPTSPCPVRIGWIRRRRTVRGLSFRELLDLADRHRKTGDLVWRVFGLAKSADRQATVADAHLVFDILKIALGGGGRVLTVHLLRLSRADFDKLLARVAALTVPADVDELFAPRDGATKKAPQGPRGAWSEPAVVLSKVVRRLQRAGHADAIDWTPGQILYASSTLSEDESVEKRGTLIDNAVAARVSQAKEADFKSFTEKVARG